MGGGMTLRELLAQAIEHGDLDKPVHVYCWGSKYEYGAFPVTGFTSSASGQEIEIGSTLEGD